MATNKERLQLIFKRDKQLFSNQPFIDSVDFNEKALNRLAKAKEHVESIKEALKVYDKSEWETKFIMCDCMKAESLFKLLVTKDGRIKVAAKN